MRKSTIALGLGHLALLAGVLFFRTPEDIKSSEQTETQEGDVITSPPAAPQAQKPEDLKQGPAVVSPNTAAVLKAFEREKELHNYKILTKKVFLTDSETLQKKDLLNNERFIEDLKNLFKVPNDYQNLVLEQNTAVDFLIEALNGDTSSARAAAEVLKSVIQDPATENEKVPMAVRENLAGVKAEVLYKWSAQEPLIEEEMQQWLPGPVSQKIWKNVLDQQEMNLTESAMGKQSSLSDH